MASSILPRGANPFLTLAPRLYRSDIPIQYVVRMFDGVFHVSSATAMSSSRFRVQKSNCLKGGYCADAFVVADDSKYGNKQIISVTPRLYDYLLSNVREPEILRELREETATMRGSQMQVSPDQAQLLAMLVQILGAKKCIEVGVYTGYSSLAIALVLPESGRLVACERDFMPLEVAQRYYERAGVLHKVDVQHGLAADTLTSMIQNGENGSYDFAFVDADKRMYQEYFELLLQLVRVGGLIVIDNVLWHGKVADPLVYSVNDSATYLNITQQRGLIHAMLFLGDELFVGAENGTIYGWKLNDQPLNAMDLTPLNGHSRDVLTLCEFTDKRLLSGSTDKTIRLTVRPRQ